MEQARMDSLWARGLQEARAFVKTAARPVILHLSDTEISAYPFVKALLEIANPELIVHTGDMADECKVGRIPEHLPRYQAAVRELLGLLSAYGGQVWCTPGNNDHLKTVREFANVCIWPNGVQAEAFGVRMELNHIAIPATSNVDFALYGHGPTDDLRYPLPDAEESVTYLNGNFHWTLIEARTRRFLRIACRPAARCLRIFIARHGQVDPDECIEGDSDLPKGDFPITALGVRQSQYLAAELQRLRFHGRILSSPFTRTLMTAQPIARATQTSIYPEPLFREIVKDASSMRDFSGRTLSQMRAAFPEIAPDASLPYPWWTTAAESFDDVCARVNALIERLLSQDGDVLLLGHGASTMAAIHILMEKSAKALNDYLQMPDSGNCALSVFRVVNNAVHPLRLCSVSHMPLNMATSNLRYALGKKEEAI